jgi:hypothetical protein
MKRQVFIGCALIGVVWTVLVAQYRYQIIAINISLNRLLFLTLLLTLILTFYLIKLKIDESRDEIKKSDIMYDFVMLGIINYFAIFGFLLTINAVFDWHPPIDYETKVLDSDSTPQGFSNSYYIEVSGILPQADEHLVFLNKEVYYDLSLRKGDRVTLTIGKGALGSSWIKNIRKIRTV